MPSDDQMSPCREVMHVVLKVFWVFILVSTLSVSNVNGNGRIEIKCKAGDFIAGQKARITCFSPGFGPDDQIFVGWYPLNETNEIFIEVVVCFWVVKSRPECSKAKEGFRVGGNTSKSLTIEIPDVNSHFDGLYTCQDSPLNGTVTTTCPLTVQAGHSPANSTREATAPPAESGSSAIAVPVLGALAGVLLICIIVILIVFLFKRCRKRTSGEPTSPDANTAEQNQEELQSLTPNHEQAPNPQAPDGTEPQDTGGDNP